MVEKPKICEMFTGKTTSRVGRFLHAPRKKGGMNPTAVRKKRKMFPARHLKSVLKKVNPGVSGAGDPDKKDSPEGRHTGEEWTTGRGTNSNSNLARLERLRGGKGMVLQILYPFGRKGHYAQRKKNKNRTFRGVERKGTRRAGNSYFSDIWKHCTERKRRSRLAFAAFLRRKSDREGKKGKIKEGVGAHKEY